MRLKHFMVFALATVFGCAVWAQSAPAPVNPHATPEARALLAYIDSISGKATITGQHNYPSDGARWTDLVYDCLLYTSGSNDEVIPPAQGKQLYELANEPRQFNSLPGRGHNDSFDEFAPLSLDLSLIHI